MVYHVESGREVVDYVEPRLDVEPDCCAVDAVCRQLDAFGGFDVKGAVASVDFECGCSFGVADAVDVVVASEARLGVDAVVVELEVGSLCA